MSSCRFTLLILFASTVVVVFSGCLQGDRLLFVTDTFWKKAYAGTAEIKRFEQAASKRGMSLEVETAGVSRTADDFIGIIEGSEASFIAVTPLLAQEAASVARAFDSRRFIVLFSEGMSPQRNVQRLVSDRSGPFREAGLLAGSIVGSGDYESARVVALFDTGNRDGVKMLETFRRGFEEGRGDGGAGNLSVHRIAEDEGTAEIRRILVREQEEGAEILVFAAGAGNSAAFEAAIPAYDARFIAEGPIGIDAFADRIIATVEELWIEGILHAVESTTPRMIVPAVLKRGEAVTHAEWEILRER